MKGFDYYLVPGLAKETMHRARLERTKPVMRLGTYRINMKKGGGELEDIVVEKYD